ncbi:MAG: LysM-like peptidoglycan-binding domain-containing protein, partial [Plesiomonas shigelloides]
MPDWQWPTLNIKLPPAEMGLSGVLRAALVALWHVPDRFNWLGPVSPFHRRWITVSALVVLLGIVLPSGSSAPEQSEAALPVAGAEGVQDNTPVALTPEALSERQPDRRIPQEMPEDLEQRSEAVPVSSPPVTRAAQAPSNTVRREAESKAPTRVAERAPERSVSKPVVKETPVKEAPVREVAKKAPEKVAEKKPVESVAKTSSAGWQSYQVGKGVTLAQVFRSGNLPLPDLMAMT